MTLALYGHDGRLTKIGEIEIRYGRIVYSDLKFVKNATGRNVSLLANQNGVSTAGAFYNNATNFSFRLKRISKAEVPYQQLNLSHRVHCRELHKVCAMPLFVRPTLLQNIRINYEQKRYIWQRSKFYEKLVSAVVKYAIIALLGLIGSLLLGRFPLKQNTKQNENVQFQKKN